MSEYAVQYVAEEHAPDPVHAPGDPTTPGKIGIWLFLASEIMFFAAILGTYVIYRSGSPTLFAKNAETLNKWAAGANTVVLILSSLTMALAVKASQDGSPRRAAKFLTITIGCAFVFLGVKFFEYRSKFDHYTFQVPTKATVVAPSAASNTAPATAPSTQPVGERQAGTDASPTSAPAAAAAKVETRIMLYDGHVHAPPAPEFPAGGERAFDFTGYRYLWPADAGVGPDLHQLTEVDIKALASTEFTLRGLLPGGKTDAPLDDAKSWAVLARGTARSTGGTLELETLAASPAGVSIVRLDRSGAAVRSAALTLNLADGTHVDNDLSVGSAYELVPVDAGKSVVKASVKYAKESGSVVDEKIAPGSVTNMFNYGPSRNVFFSSYFTLTGIHGIHVIGGIIPLSILLVQSLRGRVFPRHAEATGLYWHFVDLVWIFLFPLMYLI